MIAPSETDAWPALPLESWEETRAALHLWMQIVGKIRLVQTPWTNHSWHVPFYVTARGLSTSIVHYGARSFDIEFDFIDHRLHIRSSDGETGGVALESQTVAEFYRCVLTEMSRLDLAVRINRGPSEIPNAVAFDNDHRRRVYDRDAANRFWRILLQVHRVFEIFRARFNGKCSPIHVFWGGQDLALTRFSGRTAPPHPGGIPSLPDWVTREAYSHEVSSCGFWPGGGPISYPAFYAYAYPEPAGYSSAVIRPAEAFYSTDFREFILPYDAVRLAPAPDERLLDFLQTTYEAAADLGGWDRVSLECSLPPPRD
ncbi:MAG TPA: DUF5996 family protein [Aggregatilineales bacterium]|nr:DUF5996 family protein [Aggregatilineales bacterium]